MYKKPKKHSLMIQGTSSGVGKSVLTTMLCRLFFRRGYRVAPFKAQNITSNYYCTSRGKMGKSQAIQAWACETFPNPNMNPLLLKPLPGKKVEVYLNGSLEGIFTWDDCKELVFPRAREIISSCYYNLDSSYEAIIVEGAGSPVELNLMSTDLPNIFTSRMSGLPVLLVADIERGGAFASLVGTLALMEPRDRNRVAGLLINKFKGEKNKLQPGLDSLEKTTGLPVLGVLPHLGNLPIEEEDSLITGENTEKTDIRSPAELREKLDELIPSLEEALNIPKLLSSLDSE